MQADETFNIDLYIEKNKKLINSKLEQYLEPRYPEIIWEAMKYTALLDGKRLRPILAIESARACGGEIEDVIPTACAIEMLHAYSLIHDDLPCMDNDDFRRGKPTNHKVFGEGIAVLAGDALLSYAPQVIIQQTPSSVDRNALIKVLEEFFVTAGPIELIGGQVADIQSENKKITKEDFEYIHTHKTGALIRFSLRAGAILAGARKNELEALSKYGELIGFAFQIADDILDITETLETLGKTPGKDANTNKCTHPALYGINNSIHEVEILCKNAQEILIENVINTPALIALAEQIAQKVRKK